MSSPLALSVLALLAAARAQEPPAPAADVAAELLARYGRLDGAQRSQVVRNLERRLARADVPLLQGIQSLEQGDAAYPPLARRTWFEPREYAPSAAPRHLIAAGSPAHRRGTSGMQPFVLLPDLNAAVVYDWATGTPVRSGAALDDDRRFANYARGYPPAADQAVARVLQRLDADPAQRRLAAHFEHLYADRDGGVYDGITLYEAWRSGARLEMPDTDAIAFARMVLDTRAYVAPIPGDRRRERLYDKIADAFAAHRDHRTMRQALAATFVTAAPALDPTWQTLVDRAHWLWHTHGRDPAAVAARLQQSRDRGELLQQVDAALAGDAEPARAHRQAMAELAALLQQCCAAELQAAGG